MGMKIQYRTIPAFTGDVGGDEVYYGVSIEEPGDLLLDKSFNPSPVEGYFDTAEQIHEKDKKQYAFCFWNVSAANGEMLDVFESDDLDFKLTKTPAGDVVATAWYVPIDGSVIDIGGPPSVFTLAFDRTVNRFFRTTPISAVSPASAWPGGEEHRVSTAKEDVVIDARNGINVHTIDKVQFFAASGPMFERWRMAGVKAESDKLAVPGNKSGLAVAVYAHRFYSRVINTLPYWLYKLLHGKIDAEVWNHIRNPGHPNWVSAHVRPDPVDVDSLLQLLRASDRTVVAAVHAQALGALESIREVAAVAERALNDVR
ncbi:MAG: hypothetical protein U0441_06095 [Polyangiaceae bacterium]